MKDQDIKFSSLFSSAQMRLDHRQEDMQHHTNHLRLPFKVPAQPLRYREHPIGAPSSGGKSNLLLAAFDHGVQLGTTGVIGRPTTIDPRFFLAPGMPGWV